MWYKKQKQAKTKINKEDFLWKTKNNLQQKTCRQNLKHKAKARLQKNLTAQSQAKQQTTQNLANNKAKKQTLQQNGESFFVYIPSAI